MPVGPARIPKPHNPVPSWPELRVYDDEGRLWWCDEAGTTWETYSYAYLVDWANAHELRAEIQHNAPGAEPS